MSVGAVVGWLASFVFLGLGGWGIARAPWPCAASDWICLVRQLLLLAACTAFGYLALLVFDYTLHHARLVVLPYVAGLLFVAIANPLFALGTGVALLLILVPEALKAGSPPPPEPPEDLWPEDR